MCKLGDIIVIEKFKNEYDEEVSKHSFVVINDEKDSIEGLKYDFVSNMMCSFHNKNHKKQKLRYKENIAIKEKYISGRNINNKEGYIKEDQLYYFKKKNIKHKVIAHINDQLLDKLINLIIILNKENKLKNIISNISE